MASLPSKTRAQTNAAVARRFILHALNINPKKIKQTTEIPLRDVALSKITSNIGLARTKRTEPDFDESTACESRKRPRVDVSKIQTLMEQALDSSNLMSPLKSYGKRVIVPPLKENEEPTDARLKRKLSVFDRLGPKGILKEPNIDDDCVLRKRVTFGPNSYKIIPTRMEEKRSHHRL